MPSIVGNLKILSVGSGAIVNIGDAFNLAPKSTSKTFAGAGSFNTGDLPHNYNAVSNTAVNDRDVVDASQASAN